MGTKSGTSKEKMITLLHTQKVKLTEPFKMRRDEIEKTIEDTIYSSPEIHHLNTLHENILEYLIAQGADFYTNDPPVLYKDICYETASAIKTARAFLYRKLKDKYTEPFQEELTALHQQINVISSLYNDIIGTVRSLTPVKAKQYIMELQLNIPVEAFIDDVKPVVLPDNPILQAVRSQLLTQIGGPTNE